MLLGGNILIPLPRVYNQPDLKTILIDVGSAKLTLKMYIIVFNMLCRSPHNRIKVMSVGSLLGEADSAVVWRGPRKTALIKRFLKDTFWGRLDYLIFDIQTLKVICYAKCNIVWRGNTHNLAIKTRAS